MSSILIPAKYKGASVVKLKDNLWIERNLGGGKHDIFWHLFIEELGVECEIVREKPNSGKYQTMFYINGKRHAIKKSLRAPRKEFVHKFDSLDKAKKFGAKKLADLLGLVVDENMQRLWKVVDKYVDGDLECGDTLFAK